MRRRWMIALLCLLVVLSYGAGTAARADDDDDDHDNGKRSDFALFDGTNPETGPPSGGAECTVKGAATFYVTVTAHSSGPSGFVRATFRDNDFVQYPIGSNGSFSFSQSIGGTPGVDDRIRISNGNDAAGARLVGWVSALGKRVSCQTCNSTDGAAEAGCQNNP